jgi:Tfp pilus assembly protein PilF
MMGYYSVNDAFEDEKIKAEAFMLLEILVETHPEEAKSHSMYADFLYQDEQYRLASKQLEEVIKLDSTKYLVWEEYLLCWLNIESYDTLQLNVDKTLEFFPEQAMAYLISAIGYIQKEEYKKAIEKLETGSYFVGNDKKLSSDFNSMLGEAYHNTGQHSLSDKYYDKVLEKQPLNIHVLNKYSYFLSERSERLDDAETMIKKVLNLKPNNPNYLDTYAWILYKKKKYKEAEEVILKAIDNFDEENAHIYEHYGDILYQQNKIEKAVEYWEKAKLAGEGSEWLDKKIKDKKLYE